MVTFMMSLEVKGSKDSHWAVLEKEMFRNHKITCDAGEERCNSVILAHEPFLSFSSYRYNITMAPDQNSTSTLFLGNCTFTVGSSKTVIYELVYARQRRLHSIRTLVPICFLVLYCRGTYFIRS